MPITARQMGLPGLVLMMTALLAPSAAARQRGHFDLSARLDTWQQPVSYAVEVRAKVDGRMIVAVNTSWEMDLRVKLTRESAGDDGSGVVSLVHERVRVDLGGEQPTTGSYDSDDPRADPNSTLAQVVRAIVGKPITLTIDGEGVIASVGGLDALAPSEEPARSVFRQLFTESELKRMYQPIFALKHDPTSAEPGEEWTIATEQASGLELIKVNHRLRLERVRAQECEVSIGGDLQAGEAGGIIKTEEASIEGRAFWDSGSAQLDRFETESRLVAVGDAPGMDVRISLDSATRVKRIKGADRPAR